MNGVSDRRRGQPLMVLATLVFAWVGARAALWESPFPAPPAFVERIRALARYPAIDPATSRGRASRLAHATVPLPVLAGPSSSVAAATQPTSQPPRRALGLERPQAGIAHQLLWLAATSRIPVAGEIADLLGEGAGEGDRPARRTSAARRWSLDAWAMYRPNSPGGSFAAARPASYGASQTGAVLRYRLGSSAVRAPELYLRGTQALAVGHETEFAFGISAFPFAALPVSAHAEVRATRRKGGTEVRPAAFAVTHLPPLGLPHGIRAQAYAQAGYVGGVFATAFVDGQARADREVARFDLGAVRVGAGAWGGAQKGAARLDIGPTASLDLQVGEAPARLAVDYRVRVAGEAAPGSGVALTLSTGF